MSDNKKINHWCVVCGKGYHACDSCTNTKSFTPWRTLTDTIEHFKIFTILKDFNNGLITKEKAKELLSDLDLSDKDSFKDSAKKVLIDIYTETPNNEIENKSKEKIPQRKQTSRKVKQIENI